MKTATEHRGLGGRDALILANLLVGKVEELVTYDKDLLIVGKVRYGRSIISIRRP